MKLLPAVFLACLLVACQQGPQHSERSFKEGVDLCIVQRDLGACDELVDMRGLSDADRAQAYAARARTLANLGRTEEAIGDLNAAIKLDPGNKALILFKILLLGSTPSP